MCTVGAVVVTYNRLEKLKTALLFYEEQIYKPNYILVVNNNSNDGTGDFLNNWKNESGKIEHKVLTLEKNIGGSGGFYEGLKAARDMQADWIFVADDDAYPERDCLQIFMKYIKTHDYLKLSALCATVYTGNKIDTWHRRRLGKCYGIVVIENKIQAEEYQKESFELDLFSYVGSLLKKEAVLRAGLPEKNFFISYDDSEHSLRMRKLGKIVCLPKAGVIHDTADIEGNVTTWKKYYGLRNKIYSYDLHFGRFQANIQAVFFSIRNCRNPVLNEMTKKAIHDALQGILGLDENYRPE